MPSPAGSGRTDREVDVTLLAVAAVWGASYLAAKDLTVHASVLAVLALRFLVALAGMGAVWAVRRPAVTRRTVAVGVVFGGSQALILGLETAGVSLTSATNAGLIISLTIIFTPVLDGIAGRRLLPRPFFVAATVAVVGVALLVSGNGWHAPTWGDALMLAAAAVRALHVTALGHATRVRSAERPLDTVAVTLVQTAVCAAVFTTFGFADTVTAATTFGRDQWLGVVFLGLACSVFAFVAQLWAIRRTSASRASLLLGTEPVWAVAVGVVIGGETLGVVGAFGGALIVAGTYAGQLVERRHREQRALVATVAAESLLPQ